ncbi:MAG: carboxypeptidase regulatory-like domain-containing protein, partial [Phycisphaerales bacterium]|nr:carboxypeptidase regulatory-like domain-containing protein [Phycisphaerales bacterium]
MQSVHRTVASIAGAVFIASGFAAQAGAGFGPGQFTPADVAIAAFQEAHPGTGILQHQGRISRIYGEAFATGAGPVESAESFRQAHAAMFGVLPDDLLPIGPSLDGTFLVPASFDPATESYRFTILNYTQHRGGVPVFGGQLRLMVRNEPGYPVVLASADLRDIGAFDVDVTDAEALDGKALDAAAAAAIGGASTVLRSHATVWAGATDEVEAPRLAWQALVVNGFDEWLVVVDAANGFELYREFLVCFQDLSGAVNGLVTQGLGSEQCEDEVASPMRYVTVTADGASVLTDENGAFAFTDLAVLPPLVQVTLNGKWFDVFTFGGADIELSVAPGDPLAVDFLLNADNTDPLVRAQVNGYHEANRIRDYVLNYNPGYPTLQNEDFTVNVNRTDGFCPGNAWYSSAEQSLNFCQEGGNSPNTAWSSVVHHEYGHHLVWAAGSGQGAYGEGMGDCMSVLVLDSPLLGLGFFNNCSQPLRNADNNCQFQQSGCSSCGSEIHACGQLISGCIWDLREQLYAIDPIGYRDTLSDLTINSILLHNGSTINSAITVDFLTLDDDNGNILDGTPHYAQIDAAF